MLCVPFLRYSFYLISSFSGFVFPTLKLKSRFFFFNDGHGDLDMDSLVSSRILRDSLAYARGFVIALT